MSAGLSCWIRIVSDPSFSFFRPSVVLPKLYRPKSLLVYAVEMLPYVIDGGIGIDHLLGELSTNLILGKRGAKARIVSCAPSDEGVLPTIGRLACGGPLAVDDCSAVLMARERPRLVTSSSVCNSNPLPTLRPI